MEQKVTKDFNLTDEIEGIYLFHKSDLGEYHLTSDAFIHTYSTQIRTEEIIKKSQKMKLNIFSIFHIELVELFFFLEIK